MEPTPTGLHPPLPIRSNLSLREISNRHVSAIDPRLQRHPSQDRRRPPINTRTPDRIRHGGRASPTAGVKPLLPASARKLEQPASNKSNKALSTDQEKGSPIEGVTVGREGRHFTVANVGQNGQIYLRPTIRPNNQRYPQTPVIFPATPPSTAGLDPLTSKDIQEAEIGGLNNSIWSQTPMTESPSPNRLPKSAYFDFKSHPNHRRAVSDSTAHDITTGLEGNDTGVFRVVISKPQNGEDSRTAEDVHPEPVRLLQVAIPSYKLGTPRFTLRGTPLIRGSSYAPTEDLGSGHASFIRSSPENLALHQQLETHGRHITSLRPSRSGRASPTLSFSVQSGPSSPIAESGHSVFMPSGLNFEPAMFDALTFEPACHDRTIVRYAAKNKTVIAATPPRLVAEITSPNFLDYDLISDFFLTFRTFLETPDLLRLLISRLRWTLSQDDQSGMIVKVRTFVALRHWILNYFADDFVVDHHLRTTFCDLLNAFTDELRAAQPEQKVPLKIIGELKKCWRRVCSQYWDGPQFSVEVEHDVPITPGGIAGHRDPTLTPNFWETTYGSEVAQANQEPVQGVDQLRSPSCSSDIPRVGHFVPLLRNGVRPSTPTEGVVRVNQQSTSPTSIASFDVISCSFPTKALRPSDANGNLALWAHPADPSSIYTSADPVASTPRALAGKRARPQTSHRRNNSLSDSLREHGNNTEQVAYKNSESLFNLPYAGSLVRGDVLPPGQAFVDLDRTARFGGSRQTTLFQSQAKIAAVKGKASPSAMSSQGMRRLLGGVRRALSTRSPGTSHDQEGLIAMPPIDPRGATTNRLPGTALVPQIQHTSPICRQRPLRIDTLGAQAAEDFKKAVREDTADMNSPAASGTISPVQDFGEKIEYSAAHLDSFDLQSLSDAAITTGSKSIVIVDGTAPPERLAMTGALPFRDINISSVNVTEGEGQFPGRDPTPPTTPPSGIWCSKMPRWSSQIFGPPVYGNCRAEEPLAPADMAKWASDGHAARAAPFQDTTDALRSSVSFVTRPSRKPPAAYHNRHRRQQPSRSSRSRGPVAQRRWASSQSRLTTQSAVESFDATTCSVSSIEPEVMPPPSRVVRRKPGGDLRGAAYTTQLGTLSLPRSRSIPSLTVYSDSMRGSYFSASGPDSSESVDNVTNNHSHPQGGVVSLGAMAEQGTKRPRSLFSTPSSEPIMRPSFQTEAQKLAQIPDDTDDDGGVESALLKLEGRYERKIANVSVGPQTKPDGYIEKLKTKPVPSTLDEDNHCPSRDKTVQGKQVHCHLHIEETRVPHTGEGSFANKCRSLRRSEISSFLSEDSTETYNSMPLLDRGLTDEERGRTNTREWTDHSILEGPDTPIEECEDQDVRSSLHASFEFINRAESLERAPKLGAAVKYGEGRSFLDVESDNDSELSSELSTELVEDSRNLPPPLPLKRCQNQQTAARSEDRTQIGLYADDGGSSIKLTFLQALQMPLKAEGNDDAFNECIWAQKPLPPTPDATPTVAMYHQVPDSPVELATPSQTLGNGTQPSEASTEQPPLHLPFVLAFDSEVLAQQFSLIEKDALNEVDWRELVEMRWRHSNYDWRSWVDFLRNTDARGVEVVIARFNIMVKWVISEIVLTQDMEERARCIIKLIHVAAHCRRYRNFATMSQITIALTSNEVGRLSRTWAMIPPKDMKTISDLESLVSPTKNFNGLRAEMEGGDIAAGTGCIPFVGVYIHDLIFNSQRPSVVASSPTTPPLVNFERCRISASIVKTLLRLLEASTHYRFQPIEGIIERCLWMSALNDDEIRKRSESLE
ncbi:ras GEF [Poronia punctata]|nr:ras GEF [Poronia punctata]